MKRAPFAAAALAVVTTGAAALLLTFAPAQAAETTTTTATTQVAAGVSDVVADDPTLTAKPVTNLKADGAKIEVDGANFPTEDVYVAVCASTPDPTDLSKCLGAPITADGTNAAWAHIKAADLGNGSFKVMLTLPSVTGSPNCVTGPCSVYAAKDPKSAPVALLDGVLGFTSSSSSSSSSSSAPPTVPSTAIPQQIASPSIVAGGTQLVVFSGFKAGEQVNLTLFSDPITLSPVTADQTGVARAEFVVPADFAAGTHRLEAIGQQSGTVGVASFQVTAPVVPSTPTPTPTPTPSPTVSSSPPSTSSAPESSSAPASSSVSSSAAVVVPTDGDSGNSLWWLWLIIAIVVIAGIITWIIVWRRKQQEEREQQEKDLAAAAAEEQARGAGATADAPTVFLPPVVPGPGGPPPGADPYGLLSGRDHPDNPSLYSGGPAGPTEVIGPKGYQPGPGPFGQPPGYDAPTEAYIPPPGYDPQSQGPATEPQPPGYRPPVDPVDPSGPSTQAFSPGAPDAPSDPRRTGPGGADGPGTAAWTPDFDDTDTDGPGEGGSSGKN